MRRDGVGGTGTRRLRDGEDVAISPWSPGTSSRSSSSAWARPPRAWPPRHCRPRSCRALLLLLVLRAGSVGFVEEGSRDKNAHARQTRNGEQESKRGSSYWRECGKGERLLLKVRRVGGEGVRVFTEVAARAAAALSSAARRKNPAVVRRVLFARARLPRSLKRRQSKRPATLVSSTAISSIDQDPPRGKRDPLLRVGAALLSTRARPPSLSPIHTHRP